MPTTVTDDSLMSESEFRRLEELEKSVKDNWRKLGKDLKEIRESKLYRQTIDGERQTWEEYCKRHLELSKQYVDKVIRAAEAVHILKTETNVSVLPKTVSQAANLSGLEPAQMGIAFEKAVQLAESEGRNPTASDVKKAVQSQDTQAQKAKPNNSPPQIPHITKRKSNSIKIQVNDATLVSALDFYLSGKKMVSYKNQKDSGVELCYKGSKSYASQLLAAYSTFLKSQNGTFDIDITFTRQAIENEGDGEIEKHC